jgi:Methyltransferase FkbM domain
LAHPRNAGNTEVVVDRSRVEHEAVRGATVAAPNIPVKRMDDLLSPDLRVDLLKIDVQGFERYVLSGMGHVLDHTPKIFFEVEVGAARPVQGVAVAAVVVVRTTVLGAAAGATDPKGLLPRAGRRGFGHPRGARPAHNVSFPDQDMYGERVSQ